MCHRKHRVIFAIVAWRTHRASLVERLDYLANKLRTGGGGSVPLIASHRISFSSSSSIRSASSKSSLAERAAVAELPRIRSCRAGCAASRPDTASALRLLRECVRHRPRARVEMRHRTQAQDQFHGAQHRSGLYMVLSILPRMRVRRDHERRRAVRIHVIRPVLRVVFDHEDRRARPEAALRNALRRSCRARNRYRRTTTAARSCPGAVPLV